MITGRALLKAWRLCRNRVDLFRITNAAELLSVPGVAALGIAPGEERPTPLESLRAIEHYHREQTASASARLAITVPATVRSGATTREVLEQLVRSARESILVIGYQISETAFIDLLTNAARKGVRVTVIADRVSDDAKHLLESWPYDCPPLEAWRGVEMRPQCLIHAKVVVVDKTKALVGSANFTVGGLRNNLLEIGVETEGPPVIQITSLVDELKSCGLLERIV